MEGASALIGAAVEVAVEGAVEAVPYVVKAAKGHGERRERVKRAKELLGVDPLPGSAAGFRSDSVHPLYENGRIHPDNGDALTFVARDEIYRAAELGELETREEVLISLNEDILLFGSPASEGLSRLLFGYRARPGRKDLLRTEVPVDLPFYWILNEDDLKGNDAGRYVKGRGGDPSFRPPWCIVRRRLGGVDVHRPKLRKRDRFIKEDFLLVTRMPNFLTDEWPDGRFVVSFGGAHGVATRAVNLLLSDDDVLVKIADRLELDEFGHLRPGADRYQLLLKVGGIEHDPQRGSYATKIDLVDAVVLSAEDRPWDDAERIVRPALDSWL